MALRKLSLKEVKITVKAEKEDSSVITCGARLGVCGDSFVKAVREQQKISRTWGWCCAAVTASFNGKSATTYLGECSYKSKEDFIKNSGYYDQMVKEAMEELQKILEHEYDTIKSLII